MDLQDLIQADQALLLTLNGSDSLFWDGFMRAATTTIAWVPVGCVLLYVIFKNNKLPQAILTLVLLALAVVLADQIASGICKPYFARWRPTQDPELMYVVDVVNDYRGGRYGFMSSHAANTFAVAIFVSLAVRRTSLTLMLLSWAALNAYTRMYLGVHYPGDILFGTLVGCLSGFLLYRLYRYLCRRFFASSSFAVSSRTATLYTSSHYLITDVRLLIGALLLTYFSLVVAGMVAVRSMWL